MNEMDFYFEPSEWDRFLDGLKAGSSLSAVRFITLMEGNDDTQTEEALFDLTDRHITLDISDLPRPTLEGESAVRLRWEEQIAEVGDLMQILGPNDPLRLYLEEIAQIPCAGDPAVLAMELAEGDTSVIPRLADCMLSRVLDVAKDYVGRGVLLLDLIQEGSLGLLNGLHTYQSGDIEHSCIWWIRQYMAAAVTMQARANGVGQKLRRAMEDYRDVDQRLLTELGRNPTLEEMAAALHMPLQETAAVAEMLENAQMLQRTKGDNRAEQLPQEDDQAVEDTAYFQMRQRIAELLSTLNEEDARLLTLRYGLEGGLPMKPQQVAARLGITAEEVTAREGAALAKLRQEN